jgi:hypothetical protein
MTERKYDTTDTQVAIATMQTDIHYIKEKLDEFLNRTKMTESNQGRIAALEKEVSMVKKILLWAGGLIITGGGSLLFWLFKMVLNN